MDFIGKRPLYCRWCGNKEASERHHLFKRGSHPELIKDVKNLIWLCNECHQKTELDRKFLVLLQEYVKSYNNSNNNGQIENLG